MEFMKFKTAVQRQFNVMKKHDLFRVALDKDELWKTYLDAFPAGSNPIFRERTEHDCSCCRSFIKSTGNMVAIVNGNMVSIWDAFVDDENYQIVTEAMSRFVKKHPIENKFLHYEEMCGTDKNREDFEQKVITWEHFHIRLPAPLICRKADIGTKLSELRSTRDVLFRSLKEITVDSLETVLELIGQGSLYRGDEHKFAVESFLNLKKQFDRATDQELFCWSQLSTVKGAVAKIRNTSIGTLLVNLSEGKELEESVKAFEVIMAPTNYKRPTALVTSKRRDAARQTLIDLGLQAALDRRFAVVEDITVQNVLFANRASRGRMKDVFDEVKVKATKTKSLDKIEEVDIDTFITNILPNINSIEVLLENRLSSNMVSLIAPCDLTAKGMFKWSNNFSWCYTGDVTDSIKERVKKAGGNVTGDICCRLAWYNEDDLDLHMYELGSSHIYYSNRRIRSANGGMLDVDANGIDGVRKDPVENIFYKSASTMKAGTYRLAVHQFGKRKTSDVGFEAEIDINGVLYNFYHPNAVKQDDMITIASLVVSREGIKVVPSLPTTQSPKEVWNVHTQAFVPVTMMMLSPNYWDGKGVGNKHFFFMLEGCLNDGTARGFFNEFLTPELDKHRKVFEMVGAKLKTEESRNQLSGVGFSSTQRNHVTVKVTGSFSRTIKILI